MEADWEFEVGPDAPVIDAAWTGFVDLVSEPQRAWELTESAQLPGLAEALARLNSSASPVWTSKCDVWPSLAASEFDADELDAPPGHAVCAMGCYIDLLPRGKQQWSQPAMAAATCKEGCERLGAFPLRSSRADLVIRRAILSPDPSGQEAFYFGATVYLTACGESFEEAEWTLRAALAALAGALGS